MKRILFALLLFAGSLSLRADGVGCPTCGDCWDFITPDFTRCHFVVLNSAAFPDFDFYVEVQGVKYKLRDSVMYVATGKTSIFISGVSKKTKGNVRTIYFNKSQSNQAIRFLSLEEDPETKPNSSAPRLFTLRYAKEQFIRKSMVKEKADFSKEPVVKSASFLYTYLCISLLSVFGLFLSWRRRRSAQAAHQPGENERQ